MGAERILNWAPAYTFKDLEQWEGKWELIEGRPRAMSPSPSSAHQDLVFELGVVLREATHHCGHCKIHLAVNYRLSDDTVLIPDLVLSCKGQKKFLYLDQPPNIVVEVLSPGTAMIDLQVKAQLYAEQGIPYYLILHPDEEWVRVLHLRDGQWDTEYEGRNGQHSFDLGHCAFDLDFAAIW